MRMFGLSIAVAVFAGVAIGAEQDTPRTETPTPTTQATPPGNAAKPGQTISLNLGDGISLEVVYIPAGKFLMGRQPTEADKEKDLKKANGTFKGEWSPNFSGYRSRRSWPSRTCRNATAAGQRNVF